MDLEDIAVFVKVVQAGSFSQAARLLGMPNTTVSAKVARVGKRLGVTLIRRTTRKLHVTAVGWSIAKSAGNGNSVVPRRTLSPARRNRILKVSITRERRST
jgi:DNA-binding transcriptional LysR family regulator